MVLEKPSPRSLPFLRDCGAPRLEAALVCGLERQIHVLFELAAIVGEGDAGLERQRARRNGVAPAQFRRIDAELVGGKIDHALDDVTGFRPAVAAIGPHRLRVGEHRGHVDVRGGRAVDAGERAEIAGKGRHADLQIGADGGDDLCPEAEKISVLVERELRLGDVVARLRVAQERFRARRHPFDRPPGQLGAEQHQRHLVVDGGLHAEAAADVAADDANLAVRHFEHVLRQLGLEHVRALQGGVDRVAALDRLEEADAAARLHGRRRHPVDDEAMFDDVSGARERGVGRLLVALDLDEADVVGAVLPDKWHAGFDGVAGGDDGRQRLVIDLDQLGGVDRLVIGLGDDESDVVADHAHPILDQCRVARPIAGSAVAALEPAGNGQVAEARLLVVGAGQYREHAGRGYSLRRVDCADARVRVRRAQHVAEGHSGKHHVGDVAAAALDEPGVLEPRNRLTDGEFTHCILAFRPPPARKGNPRRWRADFLKSCPADGRASMKPPGLTSCRQRLQQGLQQALQSGPSRRYCRASASCGWTCFQCPRHSSPPCKPASTKCSTPAPVAASASRFARRPRLPA